MLLSDDFYSPIIARLGKEILIYSRLALLIHIAFLNLYIYEDRFSIKNPLTFEQENFLIAEIDSVKYSDKKPSDNEGTNARLHIEIRMKDGRIWESYNFDEEKNKDAFQRIAQRANVKIDTVLATKE